MVLHAMVGVDHPQDVALPYQDMISQTMEAVFGERAIAVQANRITVRHVFVQLLRHSL